jgi:hypothetical protein
MDIQFFQHVFRVEKQSFEFIIGIVGMRKFNKFHFIELMLPRKTPRILAMGACFFPKTGV